MKYFECSAKEGDNIEEAFVFLARSVNEKARLLKSAAFKTQKAGVAHNTTRLIRLNDSEISTFSNDIPLLEVTLDNG